MKEDIRQKFKNALSKPDIRLLLIGGSKVGKSGMHL